MDRSWLLFMPPAGLSAWSRMTRVGRLRHEDTRLWMDLQSGQVTVHLDRPFACNLSRQDDEGRIWLGVELRQGDVRMSFQARVHGEDVPAPAANGTCDGPRVSRKCMLAVLPLLAPTVG
jgi:hypothetical protein